MGSIKSWIAPAFGAVLLSMAVAYPAVAQDSNKTPLVAAAHPLEVPGGVLAGCLYTCRPADSNSNGPIAKIYDKAPGIPALPRKTVPDYRNSFPAQESFRFEEPIAPNSPAAKTLFGPGSRMGDRYFYLTGDHQKFFVPWEQPPTSLHAWHDRVTQR